MSKRGRNDRHDTDPIEGKLIRIGHYLWKLYRQAARAEKNSLDAALETVWQAKREYRVELSARRKASAEAFVARLWKQTIQESRRLAHGAQGNRQTATKAEYHEVRGLPFDFVGHSPVSCDTPAR